MLGCVHDAVGKALAGMSVETSVEVSVEMAPRKRAAQTPQQVLSLLQQLDNAEAHQWYGEGDTA